jgi:hypothetical protein
MYYLLNYILPSVNSECQRLFLFLISKRESKHSFIEIKKTSILLAYDFTPLILTISINVPLSLSIVITAS